MTKGESLGQKLQRLRLAAGYTQEQLAEAAGVSVHNLRNWEHDHRQPRLEAVFKLAKALNVPMEEIAEALVANTPRAKAKQPGRKRTK
jgi:transcriptional regulator with XRE-family HTH domain